MKLVYRATILLEEWSYKLYISATRLSNWVDENLLRD